MRRPVSCSSASTRRPSENGDDSYAQALEEALCYGWIDGIRNRIDDDGYHHPLQPAPAKQSWSAINIRRIGELNAGRAGCTPPAAEERDQRKDASYSYERPQLELDPAMLERLRADASAWRHWQAESPSYRRTATYWVASAEPETRERRFAELLEDSRAGRRPRAFEVERSNR